jgi:excisionase family DNA binding protein
MLVRRAEFRPEIDGEAVKKLTVSQAAEQEGVSDALVYQWCVERHLPHSRVGGKGKRGKILIDPPDLDAFMASLKVEAGTGEDEGPLRHIR